MEEKAKWCLWRAKLYFNKIFSTPDAKWVKFSINTAYCEQFKKFYLVPERINLAMGALWINRNCCLPSAGKKISKVSSCEPRGPLDGSVLCRRTACNALEGWNSSASSLGRENWPWMSLWFLFYFLFLTCIVVNREKSQSMENMTWWVFMSWEEKKCLCLACFFSYHLKEKMGLYVFGIRKTDLFAAAV